MLEHHSESNTTLPTVKGLSEAYTKPFKMRARHARIRHESGLHGRILLVRISSHCVAFFRYVNFSF